MTAATAPPTPKIIVAVHGIGEQVAFATAQSVAFRFFEHHGVPPALPLGRFHVEGAGPLLLEAPGPVLPGRVGFAEVYWADIPRDMVSKGATLEEAKHWARTIIARLNLRAGPAIASREYDMLRMVLDELIDAIFIIENLTFLAQRAGLFTFNLKKVLNDYVNDVQVVTEFAGRRMAILERFHAMMDAIAAMQPRPEIYIVAHSEGSVVAFLGLLDGLSRAPEKTPWVDCVRGLMTIGSPIETHLLLWENERLWQHLTPRASGQPRIAWWNYYDVGDPIAYRLVRTREWLRTTGFDRHFDFPDAQDVEFARYPLPGKAHVDYWTDRELFAHFIGTVVEPPPAGTTATPIAPPGSRFWSQVLSLLIPYAIVAGVMFLAIYALYKPMIAALNVQTTSTRDAAWNLLAFTGLIAGLTAVVRVPRITTWRAHGYAWLAALFAFAASLWFYHPPVTGLGVLSWSLVDVDTRNAVHDALARTHPILDAIGLRGSVTVAALVAAVWSAYKPARGALPLLVPGGVVAAGLVAALLLAVDAPAAGPVAAADRIELWPILLGGGLFLYLWWLAILIFDLAVIWHSYVRWSSAIGTMRDMIGDDDRVEATMS